MNATTMIKWLAITTVLAIPVMLTIASGLSMPAYL
jgi:hypothetical protein